MDLSELIKQVRSQSDDVAANPQLWSDPDITLYLNEAQREACVRAKLIRDKFTDSVTLMEITTCDVTPDTPTGFNYRYALHPSIFAIAAPPIYVDNKLPLLEVPEEMYTANRWHYRYGYGYATPGVFGDYNTATQGRATAFWPEIMPNLTMAMRLLPIPNTNTYVDANGDTQPIQIRLDVYRRPIDIMEVPSDEPEIGQDYHFKLIDYACARMFMRRDRDTYDPVKANQFDAEFEKNFGPPVNANVLRQRREYRRNRVRFKFP